LTPAGDLELRRRVAEEAARAAGAVHLRYLGQALERDIHNGNRADYTTVADLEAQDAVKQTIARYFPGETIVGEEDIEARARIGELLESGCWLTDPLDGTQDFAHTNTGFSCVVGYVRSGEPQAGAVYFPVLDELFSAAVGLGATLNGASVRVSGVTELERALYATPQSNASSAERVERFAQRITRLLPHVEGLRMPGSSSIMVCGVAAGRYDLMSILSPRLGPASDRPYAGQPWETAAYVVLVREAGGAVGSIAGGPPDLLGYNTYAASQRLLDQYTALMAE
jgi:fructose-1,6-bisphosphatase/inositol monophosphatase family enzyme